jgi:hypothetical protein
MPPPNDTPNNAVILNGESGSVDGTTVESTGDPYFTGMSRPHASPITSNGHDVWYKWRIGDMRSADVHPFNYMVWTENADFRHKLRVYTYANNYWTTLNSDMHQSRGTQTPGRGKNQQLDFYQNMQAFSPSFVAGYFLYVQVDAHSTRAPEEGTFRLRWGRSKIPTIGMLDGHVAFRLPSNKRAVFLGIVDIDSVTTDVDFWFNGGEGFPAGDYRVQWCGGAYATTPVFGGESYGGTVQGFETRVLIKYDDGISQDDTLPGIGNIMDGYIPYQAISSKFVSKTRVHTLQHLGGKIGIHLFNYGGATWGGPVALPAYEHLSGQPTYTDLGFSDNILLEPHLKWGLWRIDSL